MVISLLQCAGLIAERLTDTIALTITLPQGSTIQVGASVGITDFDPNGIHQQSDDLLRQADQAMYSAKRDRRTR